MTVALTLGSGVEEVTAVSFQENFLSPLKCHLPSPISSLGTLATHFLGELEYCAKTSEQKLSSSHSIS